jgi:hypothetical protein
MATPDFQEIIMKMEEIIDKKIPASSEAGY